MLYLRNLKIKTINFLTIINNKTNILHITYSCNKFRYGFGVPFQGTLTTVIDTDYDDYAVVYSCTNSLLSGVFHSEYIWVLSRSGKISNPTRQNIYEKLDKLQINRSGLTMSDRSTCPTNSSTVARESDKDLASQQTGVAPVVPAQGVAPIEGSAPVSGTVEASVEPTQKSVVVPLLYDNPAAPASGSKPNVVKLAPIDKLSGQQASVKPLQSAPIVSVSSKPAIVAVPQQQSAQIQAQAPVQAQQSQSQQAPVVVQSQGNAGSLSSAAPIVAKPSAQQGSGLSAKLQQKP